MNKGKSRRRLPRVVAVTVFAMTAFVAVASAVQAIRQDSWGPIWAVGWLPAVLVASFWAPGSGKACWPRVRRLARR
jgi:hypothetical protein